MILSPLEQFEVIVFGFPLFHGFGPGGGLFSLLTPFYVAVLGPISLVYFCFFFISLQLFSCHQTASRALFKNYYLITVLLLFFQALWAMLLNGLDNNRLVSRVFLPAVSLIFFFILFSNIVGLFPYCFTLTSQLTLTLFLSFFLFFGINFVSIELHGLFFFSLFLPAGSPFLMALLLVPIEVVSYLARVLSLAIRLFANMMAGHCLLKILAGFAWILFFIPSGTFSIVSLIPTIVVFLVSSLELAIAFLQAYVFVLLFIIYLRDAVWLH